MTIKFKTRMLGTLLISNVCVLVLGTAAYFFLGQVSARLENFTTGIFHRLELANAVRDAASARAIAVRNAVLLDDPAQREVAFKDFEKYQKSTADNLEALKAAESAAQLPQNVLDSIQKISVVETKYAPVAADIVGNIRNGLKAEAIAKIQTVCTPTLNELIAALDEYMVITNARTESYISETESNTNAQRATLAVTALLSLALSVALGFSLWRSIRSTLGDEPETLRALLAALAHGDLNAINTTQQAEPNSILVAMAGMQNQMAKVVSQVRRGSENVSTSSAEIAHGNQDLSARTENQASALEKTAASMEELSAQVKHNADNARQANMLAIGASDVAKRGGEVVGRVVDTMKEINDSSKRIADIIGVIDGIAFQTNILALNAAVEAARAGDQGRGFAVVASEVRSLAGRSAEAAKEIKSLINASVERVEHGSVLVDEAGTTMTEVVASIQRVSDLAGEISSASTEQAQGVAQVGEAVTAMDQATQQNAALVEQMAAAASSLSAQAHDLVQTVATFKLQEGAAGAARAASPAPASPAPASPIAAPPAKVVQRKLVHSKQSPAYKAPAAPTAPAAAPLAASKPAVAAAPVPVPAIAGGDDEWETF